MGCRAAFELPVFAGIIVGGGFAGLKLAAGGLLLAVVVFRKFVLTLTAVEPQAAMPAAPAPTITTSTLLIVGRDSTRACCGETLHRLHGRGRGGFFLWQGATTEGIGNT